MLSLFCSSIPSAASCCVKGEEKLLSCPQGLALGNSVPLGFARPAKSRAVPKCPLCILSRTVSTVPVLHGARKWSGLSPRSVVGGRVCFPRTPVQGGWREMLWLPWAVISCWSCAVAASPSIPFLQCPVLVSWLCSGGWSPAHSSKADGFSFSRRLRRPGFVFGLVRNFKEREVILLNQCPSSQSSYFRSLPAAGSLPNVT